MDVTFSKMHGLGNDFMVIDGIRQSLPPLTPALIRHWSDRRFGIGFDQLLIVEPADQEDADFRYRIFNADGGEVEQCGNGARCFAQFVREQGLSDKTPIPVNTAGGLIVLHVRDDGRIDVDMGVPAFEPASLPFTAEPAERYALTLQDRGIEIGAVSLGNPHAVTLVEHIDTAAVETLGPQIESHPQFPQRVNAGFMQIINRQHIRLRVYERGAGETLACGTGACAAVAIGRQWGMLDDTVQVDLPGGRLQIHWPAPTASLTMSGPATTVYHGQIGIDEPVSS